MQEGLGNFYTAIVVEYFSFPLSSDEISSLLSRYRDINIPISRPESLNGMPAGSILAKMIDNTDNNDVLVFYPLLSHIRLPVKAGEQIVVLYGSATRADRIGYWVSRKTSDLCAEDPNYTHNDRSNFGSSRRPQYAKDIVRKFPDNGLAGISYENIVNNSDSYSLYFQGEPVPRYFARSPDTSIEGSNNTLIVLGSSTSAGSEKSAGTGMIDIVAGRGQTSSTSYPSFYTNPRNYQEADKTASLNKQEGDLDLVNDLSRVHVSMNIDADAAFQISAGENSGEGPAVVVKSDQVRLIARNDLKIVVGSGRTQSTIVIKSDGNIVITPGSKIKLSGESDDQPYLRYDEFNSIINNILDILGSLQTAIAATTSTTPGATALSPLVAGIGTSSSDILTQLIAIKSQKILGS